MFGALSSRIKYSGLAFHVGVIAVTAMLLLITAIGCNLTRLEVPYAAATGREDIAIGAAAGVVLTLLWRSGHKDFLKEYSFFWRQSYSSRP